MPSTATSRTGKPLSASALKLRLLKRLRCTLKYESVAWGSGAKLVAGVDEVGRGSLFGPVVAAAVILDPCYRIRGLRDSKLLLADRREVLAEVARLLSREDAPLDAGAVLVPMRTEVYWTRRRSD